MRLLKKVTKAVQPKKILSMPAKVVPAYRKQIASMITQARGGSAAPRRTASTGSNVAAGGGATAATSAPTASSVVAARTAALERWKQSVAAASGASLSDYASLRSALKRAVKSVRKPVKAGAKAAPRVPFVPARRAAPARAPMRTAAASSMRAAGAAAATATAAAGPATAATSTPASQAVIETAARPMASYDSFNGPQLGFHDADFGDIESDLGLA